MRNDSKSKNENDDIEQEDELADDVRSLRSHPEQQAPSFIKARPHISVAPKKGPPPGLELTNNVESASKNSDALRQTQTNNPKPEAQETEMDVIQRLQQKSPSGIKGLAFVVREVKKAQMRGLFKIDNSDGGTGKGLGKLGKRLRNHVTKKLDDEQRKEQLIEAVKRYKQEILTRIMKEQGFNNEDTVDEKSQQLFNDLMKKQNEQLDQFFGKMDERMTTITEKIGTMQKKINSIEIKQQLMHRTQSTNSLDRSRTFLNGAVE